MFLSTAAINHGRPERHHPFQRPRPPNSRGDQQLSHQRVFLSISYPPIRTLRLLSLCHRPRSPRHLPLLRSLLMVGLIPKTRWVASPPFLGVLTPASTTPPFPSFLLLLVRGLARSQLRLENILHRILHHIPFSGHCTELWTNDIYDNYYDWDVNFRNIRCTTSFVFFTPPPICLLQRTVLL